MDFASRDRYRGVVEMLARATDLDETVVAQMAIDLASVSDDGAMPAEGDRADAYNGELEGASDDSDGRAFNLRRLAPRPRRLLPARAGASAIGEVYRLSAARAWNGCGVAIVRHPTSVYLGGIGLLTGLIIAGFVALRPRCGRRAAVASRRRPVGADPCAHFGCQPSQWGGDPLARTPHFAQARFQEWHPICLPDHGRRAVPDRHRIRRDIADQPTGVALSAQHRPSSVLCLAQRLCRCTRRPRCRKTRRCSRGRKRASRN